ncbi:phosphoserine phosphatase SerB [Pseudochelatococcus contaminans]|uniref:Phosphoserine phosphatase n=1 Tax=Pseudochelatococcus contaminans TaxID=1538103 RepID=A0A7W5Z2M0_9HYPH|nr:phosphoserine phosphatase SerB [Pseudochelatococcus contaminans]MBB3808531.1 phosphoserine phosphatase [Pseudochelatococcus contaminans]
MTSDVSSALNPLVATLIANPAAPAITDAVIRRAAQALPAEASTRWLDDGIAVDLVFTHAGGESPRVVADSVREAIAGEPVDVIVQPLLGRRKRLFLADMDSTIIEQECIDELADFVGLKDKVSAITERAMRGEIDFEPALRERVGLLRGLPVSVIDSIIAERITLTPGAVTLVQTLRAHGIYTCLVSGGFTLFTQRIAQLAGFHENRANLLIVADEHLAGQVEEPILGREAKRSTLHELRDTHNLADHETLAVGDGANDLAMLGDAGLGVAFRAKPAVAEAAHARVEHADLTALLYAQGFKREEFVTEPKSES